MCPLNDDIFHLSESAIHQEEYFLKHDHYYGTINTFVNVNTYSKVKGARSLMAVGAMGC